MLVTCKGKVGVRPSLAVVNSNEFTNCVSNSCNFSSLREGDGAPLGGEGGSTPDAGDLQSTTDVSIGTSDNDQDAPGLSLNAGPNKDTVVDYFSNKEECVILACHSGNKEVSTHGLVS